MWLNRAGASAHGELTNVAMMQLCLSTEFITWSRTDVVCSWKKTECTWYFSKIYRWNVSPNVTKPGYTALYSNNQIKEVEKRCIYAELRAY